MCIKGHLNRKLQCQMECQFKLNVDPAETADLGVP